MKLYEFINLLVDSGLWSLFTRSESSVMFVLLRHSDDSGQAFPTLLTISRESGRHRVSCQKAIKAVIRIGLLKKIYLPSSNPKKKRIVYTINLSPDEKTIKKALEYLRLRGATIKSHHVTLLKHKSNGVTSQSSHTDLLESTEVPQQEKNSSTRTKEVQTITHDLGITQHRKDRESEAGRYTSKTGIIVKEEKAADRSKDILRLTKPFAHLSSSVTNPKSLRSEHSYGEKAFERLRKSFGFDYHDE